MTTTPPRNKYADFEALRTQAIALRREGLSRRQIRDRIHVDNNDLLNRLLDGEPAPEWTKRPNAKDDLREKARELRLKGLTYDQIQVELGCSKSSISLWVRDLPKPERRSPTEQARLAGQRRWEHENARRDSEREQAKQSAFAGTALYWAEGGKDKTYSRREALKFINSDPNVIRLYLRWLELLDVPRDRMHFRVYIHETADVSAAEEFWADVVGVDVSDFQTTSLKKHTPKTNRKNTTEAYRGCLSIYVTKSADLYRRMEGTWYGIVGAAPQPDQPNRT
jgi:transcriptional regulator with XRE-family HTH domain